jgi:hypothetical protein
MLIIYFSDASEAAIQAGKEGAREVATKHFDWAHVCLKYDLILRSEPKLPLCQDRIRMGAERKSMFIDAEAKLMTAYHEVRSSPTWPVYHD